MESITPALKDRLLLLLCEKYPRGFWNIDIEFICNELSIDIETLINILEGFLQDNLIDNLNARYVAIHVSVNLSVALDFIRKGGYQGQEAIFKLLIQKLQAEAQNLQLEISETQQSFSEDAGIAVRFERMLNLAGNIASIASLIVV
jgi:hypothetical protein